MDDLSRSDQSLVRRFNFLDHTRYDIFSTATILGCTLFSHISKEQEEHIDFYLNNFYYIQDWSLDAHQQTHAADVAWLNREIDTLAHSEPYRTVVVLTHHCPTIHLQASNPKHKDGNISPAFVADLSGESCWKRENVKLWAFGHIYVNCDFDKAGKRVVIDQRGFYSALAEGFEFVCKEMLKIFSANFDSLGLRRSIYQLQTRI
ncbi:Ser/Thr protein phosphatase superfamily [Talaromyces stipitatus ATCC 10500]|uniref:Ser/Thr protein phosphatase superfamily n=1 Tax=Talaromyces stipitatus (strain ATCC 10500 / CBS 375.48 / QM 6759 / NRRL 1006) TaxID=441959 RepID=B8M539_TALSN|nr:Ser/Thr protein phosphatase superfamily [Talaromyces stipitatus ATCC 10500]EED19645.1 Ser/Thr protein phosphatase superfamily [Talaromyces stipitatus ATCC 10500]